MTRTQLLCMLMMRDLTALKSRNSPPVFPLP